MGDFYPDTDDNVTTDAPVRRRVGHEIELSGDEDFPDALGEADLVPSEVPAFGGDCYDPWGHGCAGCYRCEADDSALHESGCRCSLQDDYPLHATDDCSAEAGEILIGGSKGVLFGSPRYYEAVRVLCDFAPNHNVFPDEEVGGHVHVELPPRRHPNTRIFQLCARFEDDLWTLAALDSEYLRSNDHTVTDRGVRLGGRGWNTTVIRPDTSHGTCEFRFWNSTLNPAMMIMSAGVSVGIIEAVLNGNRDDTLLGTIAPYLTPAVLDTATTLLHRNEAIAA